MAEQQAVVCEQVGGTGRESATPSRGAGPGRNRWRGPLLMTAVIAALVLITHIWSIETGLYLDDYAHFAHLREGGWSFADAVKAARLGIVGEVLQLWGRQEAGLQFFRSRRVH